MAALTEIEQWEEEIYQLETTDPVEGGPNGVDNRQAKELANRTRWLKGKIDERTDAATETTSGIVKQSSQSDAIAGTKVTGAMAPKRVHEAFGQFGLGSTAKFQDGINIDTQLDKTQFLNASSTSCTGTLPPGAVAGTLLHMQRTVDSAAQVWIENASGEMFVRAYNVNAWSGWKPMWSGDVTQFFGINGYQKLPSGLILQWGSQQEISPTAGGGNVTFPIEFPAAVFQVLPGFGYDAGTAANDIGSIFVSSQNKAGFTWVNTNDAVTTNVRYLAIGY